MKIMTVLGTRPEIIRLSGVIRLLDGLAQKHILVHTGQNYDDRLSRIFFEELEVRRPDVHLEVRASSFGGQIGQIIERSEELLKTFQPDRLLILGDTNSGMAAIPARRLGIPVYHMEAGNRCFDDRVPEEVNRRIIDSCSSVLLPYTNRSRENLLREGYPPHRVYVVGNPIKQVIGRFANKIAASRALDELGIAVREYFLVTMHRAENVDDPVRLENLIHAFEDLHQRYGYPIVCSLHPRTRSKIDAFGVCWRKEALRFVPPLGFFDFIHLEQQAFCVLSDSGTVQEEACIFNVPNVTIRDVTERPETLECGSNMLSGVSPQAIARAVALVTDQNRRWNPPAEYLEEAVAETTARLVLGYRLPDLAEQAWQAAKRNDEHPTAEPAIRTGTHA
jgi:UDP-N-acetylglucosamine 2-epimerase (non-hydrolysing)